MALALSTALRSPRYFQNARREVHLGEGLRVAAASSSTGAEDGAAAAAIAVTPTSVGVAAPAGQASIIGTDTIVGRWGRPGGESVGRNRRTMRLSRWVDFISYCMENKIHTGWSWISHTAQYPDVLIPQWVTQFLNMCIMRYSYPLLSENDHT